MEVNLGGELLRSDCGYDLLKETDVVALLAGEPRDDVSSFCFIMM